MTPMEFKDDWDARQKHWVIVSVDAFERNLIDKTIY